MKEQGKSRSQALKKYLALPILILSGEVIFFLPFVLPRIFRPTFLSVFGISNFELGSFFSVYGMVAIFAYLFGGPLADRFTPHRLMTTALLLTAIGGLVLINSPSESQMFWVYGFWGLTTILLFWASLMRATRILGGNNRQGRAFGILDGGRGLVAAVVGAIAVWLFSVWLPADPQLIDAVSKEDAFRKVILFFIGFVIFTAVLVQWALRGLESNQEVKEPTFAIDKIKRVIKLPAVWYQAVIILCAYSGYRVADDFSLMAQDVLGYDEVKSAGVGTLTLWLRPVAAISAGIMADKVSTSRMIQICFALMFLAGLAMGFGPIHAYTSGIVIFTILATSTGVFAMRGLYFAVMEEGRIPLSVTGTAVGLASIVGYLPDIYMAPLMGVLLDNFPGVDGHRYVFRLLAGFALVGAMTTWLFRRRS